MTTLPAPLTDKQAALNNILTLLDPEAIVRGSGFAYLLPKEPLPKCTAQCVIAYTT